MTVTSVHRRVSHRVVLAFAGLFPTALLAGGAAPAGEAAAALPTPTAVIELFTSQGCANCPPADALLDRLAAEPGVIALSLPIDYWNYLGWPDTRATPQNSARQMAYAAARGDRDVFTPQVVINGRHALLGTDEDEIRREAKLAAAAGEGPVVPVSAARNGDILEVRVGAAGPELADQPLPAQATIWVAAVEPNVAVNVERGENAGRKIVYRNVVRHMQAVGIWRGEPMAVDLPLSSVDETGRQCIVVLLQADQNDNPGPILGAAFLP